MEMIEKLKESREVEERVMRQLILSADDDVVVSSSRLKSWKGSHTLNSTSFKTSTNDKGME